MHTAFEKAVCKLMTSSLTPSEMIVNYKSTEHRELCDNDIADVFVEQRRMRPFELEKRKHDQHIDQKG